MIKFRPFTINYKVENGEVVVYMYGRDQDKKHRMVRVIGTEPYFYAVGEAYHPSVVRIDRDAAETMHGKKVNKIVTKTPRDVRDVRELYDETWEADVLYQDRIRYDHGIMDVIKIPDTNTIHADDIEPVNSETNIDPRVVIWDIETYDKGGFGEASDPHQQVVSVALWDSYTDSYLCIVSANVPPEHHRKFFDYCKENDLKASIIGVDNEKELFSMLKATLDRIKPDILCGWNSGEWSKNPKFQKGYDVPYITNRAQMKDYIYPEWRNITLFDLQAAYARKKEGESGSKALEYVSKKYGLPGKIQREAIWELYERDISKLLIYNLNDVYLTKEVMNRGNLLNFFIDMVNIMGCSLEYFEWETRMLDSCIFHWLKHNRPGIVQQTRDYPEGISFIGGKVIEPAIGIFDNVIAVDNKGEYAHVMLNFNMSMETKRYNCTCDGETCYILPSGRHYAKEPKGIIPSIIEELLEIRQQKKDQGKTEEYRVVKEIVNSIYGATGASFYRYYDHRFASDITHVAREHLLWNKKFIEENGGQVIAGDTDSCMFMFIDKEHTYEETKKATLELVERLNESLKDFVAQYKADECKLKVEFEYVFEKYLQAGKKKHYVCIYRDDNGNIEYNGNKYKMKVRGFALRKSSVALLTKDVQREVFIRALTGKEVTKYLRQVIRDMKSGVIPPDLFAIPTGIGKTEEEYQVTPQHLKAALWSNEHLGKNFKKGSKPRIMFGNIRGKPPTKVFALEWGDELPLGTEIDWKKTIERVIIKPLKDVFTVLMIAEDEIIRPTRKLEEYF